MSLPETVGVVGGGRMGAGIAHAFLTSGSSVVLVERDSDSATAASERIGASVAASIDRGLLGKAADYMDKLDAGTDYSVFSGCQLVIEAVPEIWELKVQTLKAIEEALPAGGLVATNTSALSVSDLALELSRPQAFLGMHFFNPVPASSLIEVVVGKQTSQEALAQVSGWVEELRKTPIVVNDAPGFASSRLGVAIALEAMRMLEEGVASAQDIDNAMVLGYKHPVGPLRTTDIVGLDVRLEIADYLASRLGERFKAPEILRQKVARGELGRKSQKGFFDWA